jgi:Domain of unknown function (DUF4170)
MDHERDGPQLLMVVTHAMEPNMADSLLSNPTPGKAPKQLLHLVFGGELTSLEGLDFRDLKGLDIVGIFPNYAEAHKAWKGAAQRTVDNAHMRRLVQRLDQPWASNDRLTSSAS